MAARSEIGQGFANPDGTTTLVTGASPRWVHRADGSWADIDPTLTVASDGSITPRAISTDVRFSAGGAGPMVTLKARGKNFTMAWPGKLPAPTIEGATARYADVLPGVDLALTANATGFQHVLIVKNAAAAANPALKKIRFRVGGDVKAKRTPDGRVGFTDASSKEVAATAAASVWDSSIDPAAVGEVLPGVSAASIAAHPSEEMVSTVARPGLSARSSQLSVGVAASGELELTPDQAMLSSSKTVYPVYIDPAIGPGAYKWAYSNNINSNWDVGNLGWVGRNTYDGALYRSYFDFATSSGSLSWAGSNHKILGASMNIWVYHTWSCGDTNSYMFRPTGGTITSGNAGRMDWGTRPLGASAIYLAVAGSHANKAGGCGSNQPDYLASFASGTLNADLQAVANAAWGTYPVGLCACDSGGGGESTSDRWKKYYTNSNWGSHDWPALSVTYDTVPTAPSNLNVSGVACGGVVGTTSPVLSATYNDADGADTLSATFAWKDNAVGTVTNVAGPSKPAGNVGSTTLALGAGAEGHTYSYQVVTSDGYYSSPWSSWCDFTVNASPPPQPVVTSVAYPAGTTAHGGPGVSGDFKFSVSGTTGQDVTSYAYGWTDPPTSTVTVAAGQPSPVFQLTPPRYGQNTLYVYAKDPAGTPGPTKAYLFTVGAPSAAIANLPLDDIRAHNWTDQVSGTPLTLSNPAPTWKPDSRIVGANGSHFDSGQSATETVAGLDTAKSFSVSAWLKPTNIRTGNMTAIGQDTDVPSGAGGFYLGLRYTGSPSTPHWSFMMMNTSATTSSGVAAYSPATFTTADLNRWAHLTAVYDASEKIMRLYVNGALVGESPRAAAPWTAVGPLSLGRGWWNGGSSDAFDGDISDVRVWNRAITIDDLTGTDADAAKGIPAQQGILAPVEVGNWDFNGGSSCYCDNVLDTAYFGRQLTLDAGWAGAPPTSAFAQGGHDGNDMLQLDGIAGGATTSTRVLKTDDSLSVSAWVYLTRGGAIDQVILQQGDTVGSAMKLLYSNSGKWAVSITNPNGTGGLNWFGADSNAPAALNTWVHLVGTFNAGTGRVTLYVNGVAQTNQPTGATGWDSTGALRVGTMITNAFFQGNIDQVRVFQGALNAREVTGIYNAG
ncbi:hypothetical protein Cs7R123_63200 [Catellatospora sp. TT07R-123]|nr:hypothetical protein Cs7R123_63200 [Catellatospora sp. TT07R-123]